VVLTLPLLVPAPTILHVLLASTVSPDTGLYRIDLSSTRADCDRFIEGVILAIEGTESDTWEGADIRGRLLRIGTSKKSEDSK
jgi:hypothetical protein